jgi:hypothetical protein
MRYLIVLGALGLISCGDSFPSVGNECREGGAIICGDSHTALVCERPDSYSERMWRAVDCAGGCFEDVEGVEGDVGVECSLEGAEIGGECLEREGGWTYCGSDDSILRCQDGVVAVASTECVDTGRLCEEMREFSDLVDPSIIVMGVCVEP